MFDTGPDSVSVGDVSSYSSSVPNKEKSFSSSSSRLAKFCEFCVFSDTRRVCMMNRETGEGGEQMTPPRKIKDSLLIVLRTPFLL